MKKHISRILNIIYLIILILFLLDAFTQFEIKGQLIKSIVYYGFPTFSLVILIWNLIFFKRKWKVVITLLITAFNLILILKIGLLNLVFAASSWQTKTVLHEVGNRKIEFQLQDIGALGYNKRTVEVFYLTDYFMIVNPVEKKIINQKH